ncbi:MAG: hypothetical protein AAGF10_01400 [Verrucomicrobiota bacterium]
MIGYLTAGHIFASPQPAVTAEYAVVVFYQSGCGDCERLDGWLDELVPVFPELQISKHNIKDAEAIVLNEALAEYAALPAEARLQAPAVFTRSGALSQDELSFEALVMLLEATDDTRAVPAPEWTKALTAQSPAATARLESRFAELTGGIVIVAGLLDGINPCAFATILFFLAYLKIAQRSPAESLLVGYAFALGIFLTYFLLGLGLARALAEAQAVRWLALAFNGLLAALALILALLSLRDGILCLQGKLADTALKLPMFLRKRINATIRQGAKRRHFILAALLTGVVVSILELACTGQVYLPTILYMQQQGSGLATGYLVLYNIAFVIPLLAVIHVAYFGLSHERLSQFFQDHVAWVKFATAALFLVMLAVIWFTSLQPALF